jgi:hypothetical protein
MVAFDQGVPGATAKNNVPYSNPAAANESFPALYAGFPGRRSPDMIVASAYGTLRTVNANSHIPSTSGQRCEDVKSAKLHRCCYSIAAWHLDGFEDGEDPDGRGAGL